MKIKSELRPENLTNIKNCQFILELKKQMNIRTNRLHSEKRAKAARGADNEHLGCYEFYNF